MLTRTKSLIDRIEDLRRKINTIIDKLEQEINALLPRLSKEEREVLECVVEDFEFLFVEKLESDLMNLAEEFGTKDLPFGFCCELRVRLDSEIDRECESSDAPFCPTVEEVAESRISEEEILRKIYSDEELNRVKDLMNRLRSRFGNLFDLYRKCVSAYPRLSRESMCRSG